jgi:rubrerythrin
MAFTVREIIVIAISIEEAGYDFYIRSGGKFNDPAIKDVFDFLAREELAHKEIFRALLRKDEADAIIPDELTAYLKTIGGIRVFGGNRMDPDQIVSGINKPIDAIRHAFDNEKESILFYSEMKELYPADGETTSLLDRIIAEERKHVIALVSLAEKIRLM